jgi:hypothetical protein
MGEVAGEDRERLIRETQERLRQIVQEHKAANAAGSQDISFDPGGDPVMQEAVIRLIQEQAREVLVARGVGEDEVNQTVEDIREQFLSFLSRR